MKPNRYIIVVALQLLFFYANSQSCTSAFLFQNTGITNTVWFKDQSVSNQAGWQRDYTQWNFSDGSLIDTNKILAHTFPTGNIYNVIKTTKFSQTGNPSNFCVVKDSMYVDASLSATLTCFPQNKMTITWLTDSTYGISSYISGCAYTFKEIAVTMGSSATFVTGPMPCIFSNSQGFFTYTLPRRDTGYIFTHHIDLAPTFSTGIYISKPITKASIPTTPTNCHASFFMLPADSTYNNWLVQNYSSGSAPLSYLWNFGDGNTSTLVSPAHTYSTVGTYTVCLTVTSGTCSDTFCSTALTDTTMIGYGMKKLNTINMNVSVKEITEQSGNFSVYPNPSSGILNFEFNTELKNEALEIVNILGQTVATETITGHTHKINFTNKPAGIYFVKVGELTKKIIAE